ncbi:MAG: hypothetical protein P8013_04910 [Candidatus Sulfobium sp.]|jgi:hypothetical protein
MNMDSFKKYMLPPGPILSLTLIGLMFLSALLYYRAIKIQRFLEPAFAISEPRIQFAQNVNDLLVREFGGGNVDGIRFGGGSIFAEQALLLESEHHEKGLDSGVIEKLSRVFLAALHDPDIRGHVSLILVNAKYRISKDSDLNRTMRSRAQHMADMVLNALYAAEPRLEKYYGGYFAASALPVAAAARESGWIEFRIVPTERMHIEVLQRLGKYVQ